MNLNSTLKHHPAHQLAASTLAALPFVLALVAVALALHSMPVNPPQAPEQVSAAIEPAPMILPSFADLEDLTPYGAP
jgi:hypothetical protein